MVSIFLENKSGFEAPKYAHPGDSGMDVRAAIKEPITLGPLERHIFPTGIKALIPDGYEIQVRSRSGMVAKKALAVANGIGTIDASFRGEIGVILINLSNETQTVEPGERIAQLVVAAVEKAEITEIEKVPDTTNRGEGAYGSSGRF